MKKPNESFLCYIITAFYELPRIVIHRVEIPSRETILPPPFVVLLISCAVVFIYNVS